MAKKKDLTILTQEQLIRKQNAELAKRNRINIMRLNTDSIRDNWILFVNY
jgi:hypothetical protein